MMDWKPTQPQHPHWFISPLLCLALLSLCSVERQGLWPSWQHVALASFAARTGRARSPSIPDSSIEQSHRGSAIGTRVCLWASVFFFLQTGSSADNNADVTIKCLTTSEMCKNKSENVPCNPQKINHGVSGAIKWMNKLMTFMIF